MLKCCTFCTVLSFGFCFVRATVHDVWKKNTQHNSPINYTNICGHYVKMWKHRRGSLFLPSKTLFYVAFLFLCCIFYLRFLFIYLVFSFAHTLASLRSGFANASKHSRTSLFPPVPRSLRDLCYILLFVLFYLKM